MNYRPMAGSSLSKEDAQKVGEYLEQLGEFSPHDIVNAARPENSPLHPHFEWNDLKAAEKFRVVQARHLVNSLSVVIQINNKPVETRAFHSITVQRADDKIEMKYTAIRLVSANPEMREQVIEKALHELEGWRSRYEQYQSVFGSDIFSAIEKTQRRVRRPKPAQQPSVNATL